MTPSSAPPTPTLAAAFRAIPDVIRYAVVFLGALRAGVVVAPLAPGSTPDSLARMLADAGARLLFTDTTAADTIGTAGAGRVPRIALDGSTAGQPLESWLAAPGTLPAPVALHPAWPFNIIYSSGTTGRPRASCSRTHALGHVTRGAHLWLRPGHRDAVGHAAVFQHHAGGVLPDAGLWRHACC
jgi:long-chain acyl-CoA synthetase